jgi:hypothetical protein
MEKTKAEMLNDLIALREQIQRDLEDCQGQIDALLQEDNPPIYSIDE